MIAEGTYRFQGYPSPGPHSGSKTLCCEAIPPRQVCMSAYIHNTSNNSFTDWFFSLCGKDGIGHWNKVSLSGITA